ncbi:hypothetical protein BKA81DRAFT_360012 [Phyllosticta paracitricarpa]
MLRHRHALSNGAHDAKRVWTAMRKKQQTTGKQQQEDVRTYPVEDKLRGLHVASGRRERIRARPPVGSRSIQGPAPRNIGTLAIAGSDMPHQIITEDGRKYIQGKKRKRMSQYDDERKEKHRWRVVTGVDDAIDGGQAPIMVDQNTECGGGDWLRWS